MNAPDPVETDIIDLTAPYLGVVNSAKGYVWKDRLAPTQSNKAIAISQRHNLSEVMGRVLAARNVDIENVEGHLNPSLKEMMPDPNNLLDMDKGAARIAKAIMSNEKIAVFGDYDVDGGSSCALLSRFIQAHGQQLRIYIPDRISEGYGPNPAAIERLVEEGAGVIVTVDCGITSHEALAPTGKMGCDVIIVDHHQADVVLPDVYAVINPNRQDDLSGLGNLAAAGVVFLLLVATLRVLRTHGYYSDGRKEPDLLKWLDIVALATVCDVVSLTGLNRAYVAKGLQVMAMRGNPGIRHLLDIANVKSAPDSYHLGFIVGPRINAGGRIGDAALGALMLSTEDDEEAARIAGLLDGFNKARRELETGMLEEASALADQALEKEPDLPITIVGSKSWHKGLVGLLASRLKDKLNRPALAISWNEKGEGTGSARSVPGLDIGAAIRKAVEKGHLIKGGGHAMAAGLTVSAEKYGELEAFLQEFLRNDYLGARDSAELKIDGALTPRAANLELMAQLDRAGPYGPGNPSPRFVFPAQRCNYAKIVGDSHVSCSLTAGDGSKIDGIAFRAAETEVGRLLLESAGMPIHVAGQLKMNSWGGRERIQLVISDVADPRMQRA